MIGIIKHIAYVFSLAFQIAGAFLLMENVATEPVSAAKDAFAKPLVHTNKQGIIVNEHAIRRAVERAWINRISFGILFIGYILSAVGEKIPSIDTGVTVFFVAVFGVAVGVIGYKISERKASKADCKSISVDDVGFPEGTIFFEHDDSIGNMRMEKAKAIDNSDE